MSTQYDEVVCIDAPINTIKARQEQVKRKKRRKTKHMVDQQSTDDQSADTQKNLPDYLFPNGI
jgi:hypothetical protein